MVQVQVKQHHYIGYIPFHKNFLKAVIDDDDALTQLDIVTSEATMSSEKSQGKEFNLLTDWVYSYLEGDDKDFPLEIKPKGSLFQLRVWHELQKIPFGHTVSYGKIAEKLGNKNSARAVGTACGQNPILIVIPCHRVITASRSLGGFKAGLDVKKYLHDIEGIYL